MDGVIDDNLKSHLNVKSKWLLADSQIATTSSTLLALPSAIKYIFVIEDLSSHEAFENDLKRFCAPILGLRSSNSTLPPEEERNGTCALIDTGTERVFVTCHHVWEGWKQFKQKDPEAELWLGLDNGIPFNLTNADILDSDKDLDLVVIRANVDHLQLRSKAFYRIPEWPIQNPKVGDAVAIIGFAGTGKTRHGSSVFEWRTTFLGFRISGVNERNITLVPERPDRKCYTHVWEEKPHGYLGGMSGSPAWLLRRVGPPSLVGFLYEGNSSKDMVFLTPARHLQRNGTLQRE